MPAETLDDLIAAIRARGEPIDYESLLNWPAPATDMEGFKAAKAALDAYAETKSAIDEESSKVRSVKFHNAFEQLKFDIEEERKRYRILRHDLETNQEDVATSRASGKNEAEYLQKLFSARMPRLPRNPVPKVPFLDDKPEVEQELSTADWRIVAEHLARFQITLDKALAVPSGVDWRPGIKPESYFNDASEYHQAHYLVRLLCLTAIWRALRLGQDDWDKYFASAVHLAAGASSLRLLMSQLVYFAGVQRIVDTATYILHHSAVVPDTLGRLASTLASLDDENMLERMYVGERVFGFASNRDKLPKDKREGDWWNRIKREKKISDSRYYLSNMARLIEIARLPLRQRFSSWLEFIQEPNEVPKSEDTDAAVNDVARPALIFNLNMLTRMRVMRAALLVLCNGIGSTAIGQLLPRDPFDPDGGPMRHRKTKDGFVVYSVGFDQADSGGCVELMDDRGLLQGMIPGRLLTKDIVLTATPRQNGGVSLMWS